MYDTRVGIGLLVLLIVVRHSVEPIYKNWEHKFCMLLIRHMIIAKYDRDHVDMMITAWHNIYTTHINNNWTHMALFIASSWWVECWCHLKLFFFHYIVLWLASWWSIRSHLRAFCVTSTHINTYIMWIVYKIRNI